MTTKLDVTQAGISLLPADTLGAFHLSGSAFKLGKAEVVSATHPNFTSAIRAQTLEKPDAVYNLQLSAANTEPIAAGDIIMASFWARTIESPMEEGFVGFTFEGGTAPFKRSFGLENSAGTAWKQFQYPFKAAESYASGQALMNLRLGYAPQTIEIGGISLRNLGQNIALEILPATRGGYAGIEPDAPWRKAALERIERIRKADLKVVVRDKNGKPVPNAQVKIEQTRSAFAFGSAVSAKALISSDPNDVKYQQVIKEQFNRVVFENDLKWHRWVNPEDRAATLKATSWLQEANIDLRGHVLVWPSWRKSPPFVQALSNDKPALAKLISDHITDEAGAMNGKVAEWDVLNEPFGNHDILDLLGPQVQTDWFKLARKADPNAKLYINDYGILEGGGNSTKHQEHFENTISYLLSQNAPLDGIGIQGHFGWNLTPPTKMLEILDRLSKFNKPIQITEFDVQITNEALQADFTRDFLTAMFSHPSVNGVVMRGFWEGRHYAPSAALWRKDWTPKPNGKVWLDLVQKQWRTNETKNADATGELKTRAFMGDYRISVVNGSQTKEATLKLPKEGANVTINLP